MSTPTKYPLRSYLCQYKNAKGKWMTQKEVETIAEASNWFQTTTHQPKVRIQLKIVNVETLPQVKMK